MDLGNPLGNCRQRPIALALVLERVVVDEDSVRVSAPLAHQGRAGLERETKIDDHRGLL
jgi:hypothetical protein